MTVTVIVPTLASAARKFMLDRAVRSALAASKDDVTVLVCVNGASWVPDAIEPLRELRNVQIYQRDEPSLPKAVAFGRSLIKTPFFTFLDDDDELLPRSIDVRLAAIHDCDVVISNGIRKSSPEISRPNFYQLSEVPKDPLGMLFVENWLASCGGIFRTAQIGQSYFDDLHPYAEWTWLAFQLAMDGKKLVVVDQPTFVINETQGSASRSIEYRESYLALFERMLGRQPPSHIARIIRRRLGKCLHDLSAESLARGDLQEATARHLRSLLMPGGWRYLVYSRHLVSSLFRKS